MDLRDYIRMIRRGWLLIVVVILLSLSVAAAYLSVFPKQYSASTTLLVTVNRPGNIGEATQGVGSATQAAATYAGVITSAVVIGPAAASLSTNLPLSQALAMVTAGARENTGLIDITVTGADPAVVASLANATAKTAAIVIPALQGRTSRTSPLAIESIQNAAQPTSPVSPNQKQILSLGLIFGVVLGLALAIATQTLDTRIRRPEDLRKAGPVRLLGALPRVARAQRQGVVVADHPNNPAVEAYRTLRTNIGNLEAEARRSLLVTPAMGDRDPAEVPVNLAWSLAQSGRTVLLIDLDLRRAPIAELLGLPIEPGLTDMLESNRPADVLVTRATKHPRVHVVTTGTPHLSPSDVLSLPRLGELIRNWERQYDFVVLNAPSLQRYTDAAVVARETAVTLITVQAGRTRTVELANALGTLRNVGVEPHGVVLTGIRAGAVRDNRRIRGGLTNRTRSVPAPSIEFAGEGVASDASDKVESTRR